MKIVRFKHSLNVRFTKKQIETIKKRCNHFGMSYSEYIRTKVFQPDNMEFMEFKLKLKGWFLEEDGKSEM